MYELTTTYRGNECIKERKEKNCGGIEHFYRYVLRYVCVTGTGPPFIWPCSHVLSGVFTYNVEVFNKQVGLLVGQSQFDQVCRWGKRKNNSK